MIYIFDCTKCRKEIEIDIPMKDILKVQNSQVCPDCNSKLERKYIPIGLTEYKAKGFYDTDSRGVHSR